MGSANILRDQFDGTLPAGNLNPTGRATLWLSSNQHQNTNPNNYEHAFNRGCNTNQFNCTVIGIAIGPAVVNITGGPTFAFLDNTGDDVFLLDQQGRLVDYVAYGNGPSSDVAPTTDVAVWNDTDQMRIGEIGILNPASISLATTNPAGLDTATCWEVSGTPLGAGETARELGCPGAQPTVLGPTINEWASIPGIPFSVAINIDNNVHIAET